MNDHWMDEESDHTEKMPNPDAAQLIKQRLSPARYQGSFSFLTDDWVALQDIIHNLKQDGVKRASNVIADEMATAILAKYGNGAGKK